MSIQVRKNLEHIKVIWLNIPIQLVFNFNVSNVSKGITIGALLTNDLGKKFGEFFGNKYQSGTYYISAINSNKITKKKPTQISRILTELVWHKGYTITIKKIIKNVKRSTIQDNDLKPIYKWNSNELKVLLIVSGLSSLIDVITNNNITGIILLKLSKNEMNKLIPNEVIRNKFLTTLFAYTTPNDRSIMESNIDSAFTKFYDDKVSSILDNEIKYDHENDLSIFSDVMDTNDIESVKTILPQSPNNNDIYLEYQNKINELINKNIELQLKNANLNVLHKLFTKNVVNHVKNDADIFTIKNKYNDLKIKYDKLKKKMNKHNKSDEMYELKQRIRKLSRANKSLKHKLNKTKQKDNDIINGLKNEINNITHVYQSKIDNLHKQLTQAHETQLQCVNSVSKLQDKNDIILTELHKYENIFNQKMTTFNDFSDIYQISVGNQTIMSSSEERFVSLKNIHSNSFH